VQKIDSGMRPVAVALDARKQWLMAKLPITFIALMSKQLNDYATPGALVGGVAAIKHMHSWGAKTMCWAVLVEETAVWTAVLEDDSAAKRATEGCARRKGSKAQCGTWTWWLDGCRTND